MPKVSIIIPAYNQSSFIGSTLTSVIKQKFTDWECIVVNNGSTDDTESVVNDFIMNDKRIILLNENNKGPSSARNTGIAVSRGEFTLFLDSDDTIEPDMLEKMVDYFENHPDMGIVNGAWDLIDEEGNRISEKKGPIKIKNYLDGLMFKNLFPIHTLLSKSDIFKKYGMFDEGLFAQEDWDLWLRAASYGVKFGHIDDLISHYRIHSRSSTMNTDRMNAHILKVLDKFFNPDNIKRVSELGGMPFGWKYKTFSYVYKYRYINDSRNKRLLLSAYDLIISCVLWPPHTVGYISDLVRKMGRIINKKNPGRL